MIKNRKSSNYIKHKLTNEWENSFLVKLSSLGLTPHIFVFFFFSSFSSAALAIFPKRTDIICHSFVSSINIIWGSWLLLLLLLSFFSLVFAAFDYAFARLFSTLLLSRQSIVSLIKFIQLFNSVLFCSVDC